MVDLLCVGCLQDVLCVEVQSDCSSGVSLNRSGVQWLLLYIWGIIPRVWFPTTCCSFGSQHTLYLSLPVILITLRKQFIVQSPSTDLVNMYVADVFASFPSARAVCVMTTAGVSQDPCCSFGQPKLFFFVHVFFKKDSGSFSSTHSVSGCLFCLLNSCVPRHAITHTCLFGSPVLNYQYLQGRRETQIRTHALIKWVQSSSWVRCV